MKNTDPDENIRGFLIISLSQVNEDNDILGNVVGGLKFGAKLLKDSTKISAVMKNVDANYFALKNGVLYWYSHERARKSIG